MRLVIGATLVCLCVGCATGYQQQSFTGGFSETQIDKNVWTVTFKGNAYTSRDRAADFTLLRCAELALQNGYKYFVIVDKSHGVTTGSYTTPTQSTTSGTVTSFGNTARIEAQTQTYGGQTYIYQKPSSSNTIVGFVDRPSNTQAFVYDADFIKNSISRKYEIK